MLSHHETFGLLAVAVLSACAASPTQDTPNASGSSSSNTGGTSAGGSTALGGSASGTGGTANAGTSASTGGTAPVTATGGSTSSAGGAATSGGETSVSGSPSAGGSNAAGGTASGGAPAAGGTSNGGTSGSGGRSSGGASAGGTVPSGGAVSKGGASAGGASAGGAGAGAAAAGGAGASNAGASTGGNPGAATCSGTLPLKTALVADQFTADPSAHVFEGKLYFYPSHDLTSNPPASNDGDQYGMKDYHVFSVDPANCSHIIDHGEVLNVANVPWASKEMWAPDAASKNGNYFFYFPAKDASGVFRIGVATSASPAGPFSAKAQPIAGSFSIDPAVFVDDDGQAYMYFGGLQGGQLEDWQTGSYNANGAVPGSSQRALGPKFAKMSDDMLSFNGAVSEISIVDANGTALTQGDNQRRFYEGVWMHKYNGTYYLSYSTGDTHFLVYATGSKPGGPFAYKGKMLNPPQGWTTHHSVVAFNSKWYLFYHDSSRSGLDNQRCVKVAELTHSADGSIPTINP